MSYNCNYKLPIAVLYAPVQVYDVSPPLSGPIPFDSLFNCSYQLATYCSAVSWIPIAVISWIPIAVISWLPIAAISLLPIAAISWLHTAAISLLPIPVIS